MESVDDSALLREYCDHQSDDAFGALVARYINLVYSVALRQVANPDHAEEITQAVFIILAKKAVGLRHDKALSSWLFRTTHLVAKNFVRSEMRRHRREQEAYMQSSSNGPELDTWQQIAPLLDTAIAALGEKDRQAVLLRFFQKKSLSEVGTAIGTGEEAAKKRVSRALEKLRAYFSKRGVISTTAIIGENISVHSVQAAPAALATAVTTVAAANGATASASTLTLIKGALKLMAWAKAKTAIVVAIAGVLAVGAISVLVMEIGSADSYKGHPIIWWLPQLDDQHPGPKNDLAEKAVGHIGTNGLPTIISLLRLDDPLHHNAVLACQVLGPKARPAIPALKELLNAGYADGYVGVAMARIGQDGINPLIESFTNENAMVRSEVIHALGSFPVNSQNDRLEMSDAISLLVRALDDQSPFVRALAASSMGDIQQKDGTVVPALTQVLSDPDYQARWNSCLALGKFGARASSAVPSLMTALNDTNSSVQGTAAIALVQIEPERLDSLMPRLIENVRGIDGTNINFRLSTADALGALGKRAQPASQALVEAAKGSSGIERQILVSDLNKIDPQASANAGL